MITCKPNPAPKPTQTENKFYVETSSIPTTAPCNGYTWNATGQHLTPNCYHLFFSAFDIKGVNGSKISTAKGETSYGFSAVFSEIPCDASGNIVMIAHYITKDPTETKFKLSILCSVTPTHTLNLGTGLVTPNATSKFFIKNVAISYNVAGTKKQGCW